MDIKPGIDDVLQIFREWEVIILLREPMTPEQSRVLQTFHEAMRKPPELPANTGDTVMRFNLYENILWLLAPTCARRHYARRVAATRERNARERGWR